MLILLFNTINSRNRFLLKVNALNLPCVTNVNNKKLEIKTDDEELINLINEMYLAHEN